MILKFEISDEPMAKQSIRYGCRYDKNGKVVMYFNKNSKRLEPLIIPYQKKEILDRQKSIIYQIREQLPEGFELWDGPITVHTIHFIFKPLTSFSKKKMAEIALGKIYPKDTRPDVTDNLQKMIWDCLEGIVYRNDAQIWHIKEVKKYYGLNPKTLIIIEGN